MNLTDEQWAVVETLIGEMPRSADGGEPGAAVARRSTAPCRSGGSYTLAHNGRICRSS
jgi:hypothetical protein